ncbi:hypothetical protein HELRODRAFT_193204 [Helobdella robusta]|uniref:HDAg domain-containing protein n=1 Tax=Helobdella robusta TaxID=6412 RepID=T1FUR1_HELRO|nr:hypothetical protein HELRODRAFT_193204 [Helobdella robusta]ESN97808.1 hypothetical protein HELRODRAFT_193204 [Helobdella robusta]
MAASSRETDTTIWLNNKLGSTDDLWSGNSICSQLSKDRLLTIIDCFHTLQAHVKWKQELEELYRIACNDADLWVSTVADILRTFPSTGNLNAEVKDNHVIFHEIISDLRKLVRKGQDVSMYPLEGCYLSRSALISVAGPLQPPAKHFALKRRPKSAALRVELLQKSTDAANNLKKNVSTYPVKMRSFAKKMNDDIFGMIKSFYFANQASADDMQMMVWASILIQRTIILTLRIPGAVVFGRDYISNSKTTPLLLEFDALPLSAKETKKRKKMELEMQKTAKKEEQAALSSPTSIAITSPTQSTSTSAASQSSSSTMPDYAAGLLAVTSFDSLATSTATNLMNQTVTPTSTLNNLTSLTVNNLITLQAVQQQQQQPPQQQLTTSSLLSPNIILPSPTSNPQTIRFTVVPSSAAQQQQQQIFLSARQPHQQIRQIILTTPALNMQQQLQQQPQQQLQQQPQQQLQQTIVLRPANQLQQTAATTMNKMLSANNPIVIRASASSLNNINNNNNNAIIINNINNLNSINIKNLNIKSINMNVHNNNNNNTATNATNEVVQFAPTNLSTNNTISSANNNNTVIINNNNKATILNTPRHVIRTLQLQLQQQQQQLLQQQQQQSIATTSTAEESQPKKELILTREQVFEAQEMFKIFPNITRAEKALILGFMAGARDNPCPNQGPVLNIRLGETVESIEQPDGAFHPMVVETHLQLNYSSGEFKQFRKIRDREVDAE